MPASAPAFSGPAQKAIFSGRQDRVRSAIRGSRLASSHHEAVGLTRASLRAPSKKNPAGAGPRPDKDDEAETLGVLAAVNSLRPRRIAIAGTRFDPGRPHLTGRRFRRDGSAARTRHRQRNTLIALPSAANSHGLTRHARSPWRSRRYWRAARRGAGYPTEPRHGIAGDLDRDLGARTPRIGGLLDDPSAFRCNRVLVPIEEH